MSSNTDLNTLCRNVRASVTYGDNNACPGGFLEGWKDKIHVKMCHVAGKQVIKLSSTPGTSSDFRCFQVHLPLIPTKLPDLVHSTLLLAVSHMTSKTTVIPFVNTTSSPFVT